MMKVKVIFGNDIRRWRYPESKRYQNLLEFIKQTFNFLDERQFYVQFEDDEGDRLTLTSETDFEDAFSCAEQEERKSLKIFVIKGSIEDSHNNSGASQVQPNDEKEESPVQPKTSNNNNESFFDEQNNCNNNCNNNCKNNCNNNCKNNCNNKDNSNDQGCFFNCRPLVLDFLQNKEIQALLPQFVMRLLTALRKEQQQTSNQKNVLQIINEILGENQFKAITNHELYKQKIAFMLPCIAEKLQSHQHLLFLFNEDTISSWMPHLINILTTSFSNFENIDLEFDVDPIFNQFIPSFCHRNFNTESNNCSNKCEQNIHSDVCCDGCECCPIIGNRYKCSVCPNYDLCSKCETSGKHDPTHPLLKIPCPNGCLNQQYTGLHEFLRSSRHRRCHRGFNHGFHRRGRHFAPNLFRTCPFRNNFNANCFANGVPSNFCASRNECPNENKSNEMEPKSFEKSNVICECGELLNSITAGQAYNGSRAYCNVCNKPFDLSETIYHCPQKQNAVHRGGYDLCQNCVNIQIQSVISTSNKVNTNQQQNENNENNVKNVNEVKENKNDEDDFVPVAPLNVNEIENNNQGNAMSQKNSEPELVEMEDISDNEKGNEDDKFEFKSQLNSLQDMGFNDVEKLKFLLNKHKGDIQQVVQEFLQA